MSKSDVFEIQSEIWNLENDSDPTITLNLSAQTHLIISNYPTIFRLAEPQSLLITLKYKLTKL